MRGPRRTGLVALCALLVVAAVASACTGSTRTNRTTDPTPSWATPSVSPYLTGVKSDISYGPSASQKMDICYPPTRSPSTGAFLLIHGGSWATGDKKDFAGLCGVVARLGYVGATMNYRMFGEKATYADMLADIDLALATYSDTARHDGWAISKVALMGASAGGYLALMYAYTRHPAVPIGFVVGLSAPTDFTDPAFVSSADAAKYDQLSTLLGVDLSKESLDERKAALTSASPAFRVPPDPPPTILAHGAKDSVVPYSNAVHMATQLALAGASYDLLTYPNSDHSLADDPDVSNRFLSLVLAYAARYLT
ncbi:MAG TPA: alpha/beta hydrolase [Propionibacteriaceae bacterium]|nr:alpha/beta hydrolase [Propionibacteriaceae bacterium]